MRMFKNNLNIEMTKGDTLSFGVKIKDLGQELDSAKFTVKNNYDDEPIFQKTLENGVEIDHIEGNDYYYKVRVAPQDTANLEPKKYYYDLEINVNEDTFTILKGILDVSFDISN